MQPVTDKVDDSMLTIPLPFRTILTNKETPNFTCFIVLPCNEAF